MAHMIEVSKSGRAACRGCRQKIEKDVLRFGEEAPNAFGDEPSYRWYHLRCAAEKVPAELKQALETYTGEVPDRAELDKLIAEGGKGGKAALPHVDRAPTGRAKCQACEQPIEKGALRVAFEREVDTGSFVTKGAGYMHPACVKAQDPERDLEAFISDLRGNSKLPEGDVEEAISAIGA